MVRWIAFATTMLGTWLLTNTNINLFSLGWGISGISTFAWAYFGFKDKEPMLNEWGEVDEEAEYQGRKVKLNNPVRGGNKKFYVYVRNEKGNVLKVSFGDTTGLDIKRDDPARRKAFRARHNCDNPGPKTKARYWSCKFWEKGKTVTDLVKG